MRAGIEIIATLGLGDVFGEMAIVSGARQNTDVVATSAMVLAFLRSWKELLLRRPVKRPPGITVVDDERTRPCR